MLHSQVQYIRWLELFHKAWGYRKMISVICAIGTIIGLTIVIGTPKEYTASILIAPEGYGKSSSPDMGLLAAMTGIDSKRPVERDAIYPSLYTKIISSTPFIIRLFDMKVQEQKGTAVITLSRYLKERQKSPWWSIITSAPSRLLSRTMSLFRGKIEVEKRKKELDFHTDSNTNIFQLTREETSMAGAIASRINVAVDKEKRTITLYATMQDPLVAATVVDTVSAHLRQYITEYRTSKSRRILNYNEELCKEAQAVYYDAQEKYTRYADANRDLVMLTSRAELARLRNEMNLAYNAYHQMELQVQAAQAKVEKVTPVYAVIQPSTVPLSPSKPRKMLILIGCILLSAAGSIGWVLFVKDFIEKIRKRIIMPVGK